MNNFTKSNGKAYWQSITNLTCCIRKLSGDLKSSTTSLLLVMLFLFSVSSLNAQISKDQQRSSDLNLCLEDIPAPFDELDVADLYDFLCDEGDDAIAVLQEYVITGQDGTGEGTDCSWAVIYTYDIYCKEVSGDPIDKFIVDYDGGDFEAPQLQGEVPSGATDLVLCADEIPEGPSEAEIAALFTDNCGNVNVEKSGEPSGNDCDWSVTYLYKITDDCSNAADDISITYSGGDTEAPELNKNAVLPEGEFGVDACFDEHPEGPSEAEVAALYSDNCGNVNVLKESHFKGEDCGWKGEITYTIYDDCQNFADEIVLSYTGSDQTDPQWDSELPTDFEVSCIDVIPNAESLNFTDNCADGKLKAESQDDTSNLGIACEGGTVTRTWTATDDCNNSITHTITITVLPAPPAEFEDPAGYSIDCSEVANHVPQPLGYSNGAQGACLIEGEAPGTADPFDGSCGTFEVHYTYKDECDREINATRIVTVTDTTAPTIEPASDLTVECDGAGNAADLAAWLADNGGASATDDCGNVSWSNNAGDLSDDCGATGSVTVEFTASDDCGNSDKTTATFTIEDTTPPTIDPGASDLTVECDGQGNQADYQAWLDSNGGASATDTCGGVSWSAQLVDSQENCGITGYYIIEFTATDDCNNSASTQAKFEIIDTTPPTIDPGASDLTVECDGDGNQADLQAWLDSNGGASATDVCNDVTWSNDFTGLSDDCGETGTATVIFTATDSCDNKAETSATFTIIDTASPPITTEAQDETVECDGQGNQAEYQAWLNNNAGAVASDICSDVTWSYNEGDFVPDCGLTGSYTVMFTVTDDCGLASSTEGTFTIIDTTLPSIDLAAQSETVECDGSGNQTEFQAWLDDNGGAEASDDCGDISWSYINEGFTDECGATGTAHVIFTATDSCGNESKTEADFTIEDTLPPTIDPGASDLTVECDGQGNQADYQGWLDSNGGAIATDDCSDVTWGYQVIDSQQNCGITGYYIVEFTATDDCENSASTQAKFEIIDTTPPTIDPGASDLTVECDGEGNQADLQAWLDSNGGAIATDICNDVTWSNDFAGLSDDCGATGSATVIFTATDSCDNKSETSATFTIEDTVAPKIDTEASDLTVECDGEGNIDQLDAWLADHGGAEASDDCSGVTWSHDFTALSDDCGATGSATVEFTATDDCGLSNKTTATFTIEDTTPPSFDPGAQDATVECDGAGNQAELQDWLDNNGYAQAFDICSGVTWSNDFGALTDDCGATGSVTVTFTATDDCNNSSDTTATFTIVDTTDPYFTYVPEDIVLECDQDKPVADATADDDCGSADVTHLDYYDYTPWQAEISGGDGFVDLSALPNGFTAQSSDTGSGNQYTAVASTVVKPQTISFDWSFTTTDPGWELFITEINGDITVHADANANGSFSVDLAAGDKFSAGALTVDDLFGGGEFGTVVVTNLTMTPIELECPVTDCFIRQFTATDECGNTTTAEQLVTFVDTTPPVIDPGASDLTVECDGSGNQADLEAWLASNGGASATDNCSNVTWTNDCDNPWQGFMNVFDANGGFIFGSGWGVPDLVTLVDEDTNTLTLKPNRIGDTDPFWILPGELFGNNTMDANTFVNADHLLGQAFSFNGNVTSNTLDPEYEYYAFIRIFVADFSSNTEFQASLDGGPFSVETDGTIAPAGGHVQYGFSVRGRSVNPDAAFDEAYDALGSIVIEASECILEDDCGATGSTTVTFTATDDCGNSSTTTATFTIIDTTAPSLDTPAADLTVECDGEGNQAELDAWLASNGGASASDDCSDVSWSYDCGGDSAGIVFDCYFQESGDFAVISFGAPIGTNGGYDEYALGSGVFGGLPGSAYGYTLTFNVGLNRWECHEILEQGDPGFLIWYSDGDVPSPSCDPADWTDAGPFCQVLAVDCPDECKLTDECGATGSVTVTFTATDECGNPTSTTATFTIEDTTDPVITTPPADLTVECDGAGNQADLDAWLASYAGAVGEDDCGEVIWSHNFSGLSDECGYTGSAMVEFTLTDECGNDVKDTATFTIEDTTPPSIDVEASDLTVECGPNNAAELQNWLDTIGLTGAASDICGGVTWSDDFDALSDLCGLTGAATVEFTATDECGLTSKTTATFTIEDTTPPVLVGEEPGNLNGLNLCYNEMPEPPTLGEIAALFFEECGEVIVELNSNPVGDDCGWSVLHIYTIKDECDNYAADEVKIFYSGGDDTKPEIFGVPDDQIADCEDVPEAPEVTATDNCGQEVDLQYSGDVITPGNCDGNYTITRTWTATDQCGNQTIESYEIDVQDNTPPALTGQLPPFETWGINSCQPEGDYGPSADYIADQYTDNCSGVYVTKEIKSNNGNDCGWIIDIEYVVSDNCGNVADTFKLWFAGEDMNPPTIIDSEECNNEQFLLLTSEGADCPADAGTSLTPGISVDKDNPDFTVAGLPFHFDGLTPCFEDDCTDKNDLRFVVDTVDIQNDDCPALITITFNVLDVCDNAYEGFVCYFYITDDELPVLDCPEGDYLGLDPNTGPDGLPLGLVDKVPYTDNCDADGITETFNDDLSSVPGQECNSTFYTLVRTFSYTDACGNTGYCDITYTWIANPDTLACDSIINGDTTGGTVYENVGICGTDLDTGSPGQWYEFIGTGDIVTISTCSANTALDTKLGVFTDCGTTCIDGNDDLFNDCTHDPFHSAVTFLSELDREYQVFVVGWFGPLEGPFELSVTCEEPEDPKCEDAPSIACNDSVIDDTSINGVVNPGNVFCDTSLNGTPGIWYTFIGTGEITTISTCSDQTLYDTKLGVYTDCGITCVAGNDDDNVSPPDCQHGFLHSEIQILATQGQEYKIFVGGFGAAEGQYELSVSCVPVITGIEDESSDIGIELDFLAYPVPFDKEVTVKYNFEFDTDVSIQVFDTKGLLILSETHNNQTRNMDHSTKLDLSRGGDQVFYVHLTTNRGTVVKKVVSSGLKRN